MKHARTGVAAFGAALSLSLLAGCGQPDDAAPAAPPAHTAHGDHAPEQPAPEQPAAPEHNDVDVMFAQGMVPHHQQALDMSRMAATNAESQQVKDLAARIEAAQGPEIAKLNGWLRDWNATGHGDHSGHAMTGMMSSDEMAALGQAKGAEFDQKFLMLMIKHHEGAVAMARTEVDKGRFPDAQQMAREIMISQQSEIDSMRTMLTQH
ncbi:DUF305 domain-containing protein [Saccharopolyspora sp. TS4A08]|uniref:DUF305 domain-containing protein n=1 Tax=Saccharopolyspora ipomoeae TaxID=3042027 RepID=A0ABT6PV12_9PSEU|nr:DUF305 domain-containing protein [Saccharopolyspora sp. TS4A08]MDI2031828.1 DUF305 domain-containing protein [Saccharopolyspora sp. TS4A08]